MSLFGFGQDINQDGIGDFVVGAPGVGNDAGSAYIIFGSEEYTAASYTLGSIGADDSFILNAPSDNGYGGFSVAGAGERSPLFYANELAWFITPTPFEVKGVRYRSTFAVWWWWCRCTMPIELHAGAAGVYIDNRGFKVVTRC